MFKLKNLVLLLFLFSVPLQTARHIWLPESYLSGIRLDYLSLTVYLSDLIGLTYWLLCLKSGARPRLSPLFTFSLFVLTLFHHFSFLALFWFLKAHLYQQIFFILIKDRAFLRSLKLSLILSIVILGSLATSQFLLQRSIGGPFIILGERPLNLSTPQIAQIDIPFMGLLLRPYSTFPHPNSLAGYLLLTLAILTSLRVSFLLYFFASFLIILTFSKAGLLALFLLILRPKISQVIAVGLILTLFFYFYPSTLNFLPANIQQSFRSRLAFLQTTADPRFFKPEGLGYLGYFQPLSQVLPASKQNYTHLQPIHNSFLLAILECGPLLFLVISLYLGKKLQRFPQDLLNDVFFVLVTTSFFDHYWWTLQQNQLIIFVGFAYLSQKHAIRTNHH